MRRPSNIERVALLRLDEYCSVSPVGPTRRQLVAYMSPQNFSKSRRNSLTATVRRLIKTGAIEATGNGAHDTLRITPEGRRWLAD